MDDKTFERRLNKMEEILYNDIFLKNISINEVLNKGLKKHIKFILFANIRFILFRNCLLKASENNLFKEDMSLLDNNIIKICIYLEEIMKIIDEILSIKK